MKFIRYTLAIVAVIGSGVWLQAAEKQPIIGTISAANLNIRVKPSVKYSAVARLKYGDKVTILRKQGDWYEITAPQNAIVWVAANYIKNGQTTRKVNLRSGPGINYSAYGIIPAGQKVNIISDLSSEWIKIAPTPGLTAWAFSKYVKVKPADLERLLHPELEKKATHAAVKPIAKAVVKLPYIAGYSLQVEYNGTVWQLEDQSKYVTHVLVKITNGKAKPICFLHIAGKDIKQWNNHQVKLVGEKKLVKGWKLPVVIVKSIKLSPTPGAPAPQS